MCCFGLKISFNLYFFEMVLFTGINLLFNINFYRNFVLSSFSPHQPNEQRKKSLKNHIKDFDYNTTCFVLNNIFLTKTYINQL